MPDIVYIEKGTGRVVGQQNAVDYVPNNGDFFKSDKELWRVTGELSYGIKIKCIVEKVVSKEK